LKKDIIVCVKQVPDVAEVRINPETRTLVRDGVPSILNPFDEFAVEEAVRTKEMFGGSVTAVTMGPPQAQEALKTCLAMGADSGILLCDTVLAGSDTWATSIALSALLRKHEYDLIICGLETTDSSTAQVGPEIAEKLGIPQITFVNKIELDKNGKKGVFSRETDTGYQKMECRLPLVVTLVKGINVPREPDVKLIEGKRIETVSAKDLDLSADKVGIDGSPTQVVEINPAKARARAQMVIDSSLPAHERIRMIMMGGITDRAGSRKLEGETDNIAEQAGDFIIEIITDNGVKL
jgi:electron transfer flavoprotein beta subunit